jgi:transposase-like protein
MGPQIGREFANRIRQRASRRGDKWHLDEVVISIAGKKHWLWRAVDQDGLVLDILVQSRRDKKASHHTRRWHYRRRRPNRYPLIESSCFGRNRRTRRKRATSASAPSFEPVSQQTLPWREQDSNHRSRVTRPIFQCRLWSVPRQPKSRSEREPTHEASGHGRLRPAAKLGLTSIPVIVARPGDPARPEQL